MDRRSFLRHSCLFSGSLLTCSIPLDRSGRAAPVRIDAPVVDELTVREITDGATKDPVQKAVRDALIAFMAATAQAQAEATKAAQRAGIEHAKQSGERKYLGRKPGFTRQQFKTVCDLLGQATGIAQIAKAVGLTRQTIYRIKDDPAACEAALCAWGL